MGFLDNKLETTKKVTLYLPSNLTVSWDVTDDKDQTETLQDVKARIMRCHKSNEDWLMEVHNNDPEGEVQAVDTSAIMCVGVKLIKSPEPIIMKQSAEETLDLFLKHGDLMTRTIHHRPVETVHKEYLKFCHDAGEFGVSLPYFIERTCKELEVGIAFLKGNKKVFSDPKQAH